MNFKKIVGGLLTAASIFSMMPTVDAANIKDYPRVAVMEFGNKAITSRGLRDHDFASATEYAIYQLSACDWFDLIDYEQLATMAKMHAINMSGMIDQGTAVQMGKIAGAQFMVIGNVTGLTTKENVFGASGSNIGGINNAQHVVNANVSLRIVDIETGRIVVAGLGKGSSTSTSTELTFKKYRNRRIETEQISNTVTNDRINEYTQNRNNSQNSSASKDYSSKVNKEKSNIANTTENNSKSNNVEKDVGSETTTTTEKNNTIQKDSNDSSNIVETVDSGYSTVQYKLGDLDGDGQINKLDLEIITAIIVGKDVDYYEPECGDIDGDGRITLKDQVKLAQFIDGQIPSLGIRTKEIPNDTTKNVVTTKDNGSSSGTTIEDKNMVVGTVKDMSKITTSEASDSGKTTEDKDIVTSEESTTTHDGSDASAAIDESYRIANNTSTVNNNTKDIHYEREEISYTVMIGTVEVSDVQVRNAISKAVRDAVYGNMGIMTTLNNGKKLKVKTGF